MLIKGNVMTELELAEFRFNVIQLILGFTYSGGIDHSINQADKIVNYCLTGEVEKK